MADKYLYQNAGQLTEREATTTSSGPGSAGKVIGLGTDGLLDSSMLPTGIGIEMDTVQASEALNAGDLVNYYSASGSARARKADAATGKPANGYVLVAVSSGNNAQVYRNGRNSQVTGLTVGDQFLSATTPGATTTTAPTGSGQIVQRVGFATSATTLAFNRGAPIALA